MLNIGGLSILWRNRDSAYWLSWIQGGDLVID